MPFMVNKTKGVFYGKKRQDKSGFRKFKISKETENEV